MPRTLSLVCAAVLVFAAAPAFAEEQRSEVVRFSDLDLNDRSDADELIARIQRAAHRVCGTNSGQPLSQWDAGRECAGETTELAVRDVGHPIVLGQYYGVYPRVIVEEGSADPYWDDGYVTVRKKPMK